MTNKADVFIGSSNEGRKISEQVKKYISKIARCTIWYDGFFDLNNSTLDNLCKKLIGYDFAVFIGSKDDFSIVRKEKYDTIRDNIIFEYGLFTGAIGRQKTFLLVEQGTKLPSDLKGITLLFFSNESELKSCCASLISRMKEEIKLSRISMLPSTASAIAYYSNFVLPVCNSLSQNKDCKAELNIVIPPVLTRDLKSYAKVYYEDNNLKEGSVSTGFRDYRVFINQIPGFMQLFDVPATLNSSFIAVNMFIGKDYIGKKDEISLYMTREIRNFRNTLELLINEDAISQRFAKIIEA